MNNEFKIISEFIEQIKQCDYVDAKTIYDFLNPATGYEVWIWYYIKELVYQKGIDFEYQKDDDNLGFTFFLRPHIAIDLLMASEEPMSNNVRRYFVEMYQQYCALKGLNPTSEFLRMLHNSNTGE